MTANTLGVVDADRPDLETAGLDRPKGLPGDPNLVAASREIIVGDSDVDVLLDLAAVGLAANPVGNALAAAQP